MALTENLLGADPRMLAPGTEAHCSNNSEMQAAHPALHSSIDALTLFTALKVIVSEAMPQQRGLTPSQKSLLRALSTHLEAAARSEGGPNGVHTDRGYAQFALNKKMTALELLLAQLTPAEREIVDFVRLGWSNKEIAYLLDKSVRTVKAQLTSVYKKFSVRSRSRLIAKLS